MPDFGGGALSVGGAALLALLARAAVILAAAWGVAALARRASAAVRHGIWSTALGTLLALPLASAGLPPLMVELPEPAAVSSLAPGDRLAAGRSPALGEIASAEGPEPAASSVPGALEREASRLPEPLTLLLLLWAVGTTARLGWLGLQRRRVRRLLDRVAGAAEEHTARLAARLAAELGVRRPVRVLTSARVSMPLTWGVTRPVVLLPAEAADWPRERLRIVLLHELAHVRRWDALTSLVAELACAAYWPLPLAWLARRRARAEQEQACDDRVLAAGTASLAYADHLLAVARAFYGGRRRLGSAITMAGELGLKRRIRVILDERTDRRPLRSRAGVAAVLFVIGVFLPVAALRAGPPEAPLRDAERAADRPAGGAPAAPARAPIARSVTQGADALRGAEPPAAGERTGTDPTGSAAEPSRARPAYRLLEAEAASLDGELEHARSGLASGGGYVAFGQRGDESEGTATFTFDVETAGRYVIWGRVAAPGRNANSFYASLDGGAEVVWDAPRRDPGRAARWWRWDRLSARRPHGRKADVLSFGLAPGRHVLRLRTREGGTRLDAILVTSDLEHRPLGIWPASLPEQPVRLALEAESARLRPPLAVRVDPHASAGRFVQVENGDTRWREPDGPGQAVLRFTVPREGLYTVWARAIAPSRDENSFWVRANGGKWVRWNGVPRSRRWRWSPVDDADRAGLLAQFRLHPGENTLELAAREGGIRLDRLLVTDDPLYRPDGRDSH